MIFVGDDKRDVLKAEGLERRLGERAAKGKARLIERQLL